MKEGVSESYSENTGIKEEVREATLKTVSSKGMSK